jgi:hypothetical protein
MFSLCFVGRPVLSDKVGPLTRQWEDEAINAGLVLPSSPATVASSLLEKLLQILQLQWL